MLGDRRILLVAVALVAVGCGSTGTVPDVPAPQAAVAPDCRVTRAIGDVSALLRPDGELVIVGGDLELLRSAGHGRSWRREKLEVSCLWPDLIEIDGRLLVSCSERRPPNRLLILAESEAGGWSEPVVVDTTEELMIDTNLQLLSTGEVVLFATHIDTPEDLDDAVYTIRTYRSSDDGAGWARGDPVAVGRRGEHLEDTRSIELADGAVIVAYEREPVEGGASRILQRRSTDGGRSWTRAKTVWRGGDVEPGGFLRFADGELWLIVSSDRPTGGGSYDRAVILARRSADGGRSWTDPRVLVDRQGQISFGGVILPGDEVLLPSLRNYNRPKQRSLSLYLVDRGGGSPPRCAADSPSPSQR